MAIRSSTPKYEVVHDSGAVAVTGVSKTEATQIARAMNKGDNRKRLSVRPVRRAPPDFGPVEFARAGIIEALGGMFARESA